MATYSTGLLATSNAQNFLGLTAPIHLPSLASAQGADSPHLPVPHQTKAVEVPGVTDIAPERQGVDFGQVDYFKYINNDNEVLKSCTLVLKLAALDVAVGSVGNTNPRYVDDIAAAAIDHLEFQYGGNLVQTLYGDEMHFRTLQEVPEEELMRKYRLQAAGLTPNERALRATADQYIYFDVPLFWTRQPAVHWHQYAFQRLTRVVIYFRNVDYLLQVDCADPAAARRPIPVNGATTPYILDHWLRFHISAISEATKQTYMRMVESMGDQGWLHLFSDFERSERNLVPAGVTTWSNLLQTFTKFGYNLRYWIRPALNLDAIFTNNRRWDLVDIKAHQMDISGKRFLPEIDDFYVKQEFNGKMYLGNPNLPIYNIPFTDYPDMHTHAMGGFEFSNTTNPTLTIKFDAAVPANGYYVDMYLYCHNYIRQVLRGNQSAVETVQPL
jgi:hypothetical protein